MFTLKPSPRPSPKGVGRSVASASSPTVPKRCASSWLGGGKNLKVCYEAGPTGYALYWQLTKLGVDCEVIAPSLIPKKAGDKVKTDRRDAEKLAQSYQSGDLTPVWVPTPEHEALRDLVRQRAAAKADESDLLRRGLREPEESGAWTHPCHSHLPTPLRLLRLRLLRGSVWKSYILPVKD
jgi:transposase